MCNTQPNIHSFSASSYLNAWEQNALRDITEKRDKGWTLSEKQIAFLAKLEAKAQAKPTQAYSQANPMLLRTLLGFLERSQGKVLFKVNDDILQFKFTGTAYTRYPNTYHITDPLNEGAYIGRLESTGAVVVSAERLARYQNTLAELEKDPVAAAVAYGHAMGNCAFCTRPLTDDRSIVVGYGPVCAQKYGLPWGVNDGSFAKELEI